MAVLNITPDSFSDGGEFYAGGPVLDAVLRHAESCLADGATLLDVGGESTRPGSVSISEYEELDRVIPVIEALISRFDAVVSVDTSTPRVMIESATAGARLINDVMALQREGAMTAALKAGLPVCLMHMQGTPQTMQDAPKYKNVVEDIFHYLSERRDSLVAAGISAHRICLDPGLGFGKTLAHNLCKRWVMTFFM